MISQFCWHFLFILIFRFFGGKFLISAIYSTRKYPYSSERRDWNFLGGAGSLRPKKLKKCNKFNWNFQRGGGSWKKSLPWRRYGYFLELHNSMKSKKHQKEATAICGLLFALQYCS